MESSAVGEGRLAERASVAWRPEVDAVYLRRWGRRWTVGTAALVAPFVGIGCLLVWLEPLTFPVALLSFAHAWAIPELYARRGARPVVPVGSPRSASPSGQAMTRAEMMAIGLLGDLLGHEERELMLRSGLAMQRGRLGTWLVGEKGALMVRRGGRRVDCWCVRVAEPGELPGADRVAHLLLALREDEAGFATVANLGFSGAAWRVRRRLESCARPALDAARVLARA
jgi:hypothetical protein